MPVRSRASTITISLLLLSSTITRADDGKRCLTSCLSSLLSTSKADTLERKKILELFSMRTLHESPERYLRLSLSDGKSSMIKVVGYVESEGKTLTKVIHENGHASLLALDSATPLRLSDESREFFSRQQTEFKKNLENRTLHLGDSQYLTLDVPNSEGVFMVRAVGYETVGKETLPLIMHSEGYIRILDPDEFSNAFSSVEAKNHWTGISTDKGIVHVRKAVSELPLKREDLIERAGLEPMKPETNLKDAKPILLGKDPIDPKAPKDFEGFLLSEGTASERILNIARSLDEKMDVKAIYSKDANTAYRSLGFSLKRSTLYDETGKLLHSNQELINLSDFAARGRVSSTEVHEIGHAQTNRNLKSGKPDPLAIQYSALPGNSLPDASEYGIRQDKDFYHQFSSADESRQHAYNFHNSVHQRVTSEVIQDFSKTEKIEIHRLFGVNLQNFHSSMAVAKVHLDNLTIFNLRHTELALYAQRKLLLGFNERSLRGAGFEFTLNRKHGIAEMIITTPRSKVSVPIVGNAYETLINPLLRSDEAGNFIQFSKNVDSIPKLKTYIHHYLTNQIEMLDLQYRAIENSKRILDELSVSPFKPIKLNTYLKLQNAFTQVKSSVNYSPKKVENLLWVDPRIRPLKKP